MSITTLTDENMTLTTAVNILAILRTAAADALAAECRVKRVEISQSGSATLEMIRGEIVTRTGGVVTAAATTPENTRPLGGPASGLTGNVAPVAGTGRSGTNGSVDTTPVYTTIHPFSFANLNGYLLKPDPEEEMIIPADTIWAVRFLADPSTLTGWTVSVTLNES